MIWTASTAYQVGDHVRHQKWIEPKFYGLQRIANGRIGFDEYVCKAVT